MIIRKAQRKDIKQCYKIAIFEDESYWDIADFKRAVADNDVCFLVALDGKCIL